MNKIDIQQLNQVLTNENVSQFVNKVLTSKTLGNVLTTANDGSLIHMFSQLEDRLELAIGSKDKEGIRDLENKAISLFNLYAQIGLHKSTDMAMCFSIVWIIDNQKYITEKDRRDKTALATKPYFISYSTIKKQLGNHFCHKAIRRAFNRLIKANVIIPNDLQYNPELAERYNFAVQKKLGKSRHTEQYERYTVIPMQFIEYCYSLDFTDDQKNTLRQSGHIHCTSVRDLLVHNPVYHEWLLHWQTENILLSTMPSDYKTYSSKINQKTKHKKKEIPRKVELYDYRQINHKPVDIDFDNIAMDLDKFLKALEKEN